MMRRLLLIPLITSVVLSPAIAVERLTITPPRIEISGRYSSRRILVSVGARDATPLARLSIGDPHIAAIDEDGFVQPRGDGRTTLVARVGGSMATVPVEVRGFAKSGPPRFASDVIPVLTRAGCNAGACHGAGSGKGGFKLSLLGYDPDTDYEAIVHAAAGRRIARTQPENSLLLRKPTLAVAHRGGQRFRVGSPEYLIVRDWIAGGMPRPVPDEPKVARLEMIPSMQSMAIGQIQRFVVRAHLSDGSIRDATSETVFTASDESVAKVSPDGEARVTGPGEGAILVRYRSVVAAARVVCPFGTVRPTTNDHRQTTAPSSVIRHPSSVDRLVQRKLDALGLVPSGRATDAEFLRRASLDTIGRLPTPDGVRSFLADRDSHKREKMVESLLARPEYDDFWTLTWSDILRANREKLGAKGLYAFNRWIRESVSGNKPWDQFAREIILAEGDPYEVGPANFYRTANSPQELAEATSQVFLGVRIQCARCHNHPYEKWTQNQYYQMSAFFARVRTRKLRGEDEHIVLATDSGDVTHPKTQKLVAACALDSAPLPADYRGDRREALVGWLTSPSNPFFAKAVVNRLWKHFMGRGLVEPVDDLRATNPASNEELFDWLAKDFVAHGYDLKHTMRTIMLSQAYQRSAVPTKQNARDQKCGSHFAFKRLSAEQLMDALASATGVSDKFAGYPAGTHACQLPDSSVPSYFLELFGRPARTTSCECERLEDPTLGQILHLMNDKGLNARIADKSGRLPSLLAAKLSDPKLVQELYLSTFSRLPDSAEMKRELQLLGAAKDRQRAAEDLFWALLNSKEFLFNH